jgi:hypothetical protein
MMFQLPVAVSSYVNETNIIETYSGILYEHLMKVDLM